MCLNITLPTTSSSLQFENCRKKEREEESIKRRKKLLFMFLCA
jgi:hypothetical protein